MELSQLFSNDLVAVNLNCSTAKEALANITELMVKSGYVKPEYTKDVIDREAQFPTGLPTKPFPVAIAHSSPNNVTKSGIAVGLLKKPVAFKEMGSPANTLNVQIIFVLAIIERETQTNILQGLINIISNKSNNNVLDRLRVAECVEDAVKILQSGSTDSFPVSPVD